MYQRDGLFPPVTYLSETVAHVSVKFKMLSPKYEQRILKGHELQQENDKMNMKCQHTRWEAMKSFPMEYRSHTLPSPRFFKPSEATSPQLASFQTKLSSRNKVVNFHCATDRNCNGINFRKFWGNPNNSLIWPHIEEVGEQNRKFPISHFVFTQSTWYYHLAFSVDSPVPECVHYLAVKWFDGDLYLPATLCICRVDIRKIQSNMFSLPFVVLLFPVVSGKEKKTQCEKSLIYQSETCSNIFFLLLVSPKAGRDCDCDCWLWWPQAVSHQLISIFVNRQKNTATVHRTPLSKYILHVNIPFNTEPQVSEHVLKRRTEQKPNNSQRLSLGVESAF